jgi:hypothetical protein
MRVKGTSPRGRPRSRWEQQVSKAVTQKEEHENNREKELQEDTYKWRGLVVRWTCPRKRKTCYHKVIIMRTMKSRFFKNNVNLLILKL